MVLVNEFGIRYLNIIFVIDYDVGLEDDLDIKFVFYEEVLRVFFENVEKFKKVIIEIIKRI